MKVKQDPFSPSNDADGRYVLRIEVYPETEDYKHFNLKLKKKDRLVREETCLFDARGKLRIVSGEAAYPIILRSYHKTHIPRRLERQRGNLDLPLDRNPYFYSCVEALEEGSFNLPEYAGNVNELFKYHNQSLISVPLNKDTLFKPLSEQLNENKITHQVTNFFPQFQDYR